jgi:hypothetical protein
LDKCQQPWICHVGRYGRGHKEFVAAVHFGRVITKYPRTVNPKEVEELHTPWVVLFRTVKTQIDEKFSTRVRFESIPKEAQGRQALCHPVVVAVV